MATKWTSPTWRMPEESNQSKFENYSMSFDGSGKINCGNDSSLNLTSTISLSAWVKPTTAITSQNFPMFIAKGINSDYMLFANSGTGTARMRLGSSFLIDSTSTIPTDVWTHIVGTYDGATLKIYVNSVSENPTSQTGAIPSTSGNLEIGSANNGNKFTGDLDQVAIFDYALSQAQINYLYNSGTPVNPMAISGNAPIAYYPLGGSSTGSSSSLTTPNESVPSATVFDFDGSIPDFINCGNSSVFDFTTQITISAWVKTTDQDSINNIVKKDDGGSNRGWNLSWRGSSGGGSRLVFWNWSTDGTYNYLYTTGTPASNFADGNWHHIIATYDGTADANGAKIYLDGDLMSQGAVSRAGTGLKITTEPVEIGDGISANISNVQLWNTELSTPEITTLYNYGSPLSGTQPQAANLKAWYKMGIDTSNWDESNWQLSNSAANYSTALDFAQNKIVTTPNVFSSIVTGSNKIGICTISYWFKNGNAGAQQDYMSLNDDNVSPSNFRIDTSNKILYMSKTNYMRYPAPSDTGEWNHHCWVFNSNTSYSSGTSGQTNYYDDDLKFYLNGVEQQVNYNFSAAPNNTAWNGFNIAESAQASGASLNFEMSNLSLFSSVLSSGDITTLYNSGTPQTTISGSPVAWWKLDSTTITDSSGNGNTGTNVGATQVSSLVSTLNGTSSGMTTANLVNSDLTRSIPYSSYSINFDGATSSDYIDFGSSILGDESNLSISFWLNPNLVNDNDGVFTISTMASSQNPLTFFLGSSNLRLYINSAYAWQQDFSSKVNTWTHVLLSYDSATAANSKVYINGVEDAGDGTYNFATGNIDASGAGVKVIIGSYYTSAYSLDGEMSNVAVWNSSLSADQALTIYNGGVPNDISSLSPTGWWSLAGDSYYNGTDFICPDLSSNSNDGTSANMPATALVGDGPGSTANGTATGMNIPANLQGNAPNSTKNAFSINMAADDKTSSVPDISS